jgi:hypothetical protein
LRSTKRRERWRAKKELLKLAYKQLDQAAKLLHAAGEELLAEEAGALAVKVSLAEAALHPLLPQQAHPAD